MIEAIERLLIDILLWFVSVDTLNDFITEPQNAAIMVGILVSVSGSVLGTFLLLRRMAMTSDAISHTVLLGIVVAFLVMIHLFNVEPDLSSPWLIVGAALSGVATVVLTEMLYRSKLVKADAALGLAFPFLFAISVILISGYLDNVHMDEDAVMVGEIGLTWANTNSHCYDDAEACEDIVITPNDPRAETAEECVNCGEVAVDAAGNVILDDWGDPLIIRQRVPGSREPSPYAKFEQYCFNCGTYSPGEAVSEGLIDEVPKLVYWPKAITVMGIITLVNLLFVTLFYKELKLSTFDAGLAKALGFRPGILNYALMVLVSVTAVGAFDAVGSILVVAFFVIPPATAYLLTNRLSLMLLLSPIFGALAGYTGYALARGDLLIDWNTSISASMVIMTFVFFIIAWIVSPYYGLVAQVIRRRLQRERFSHQMLLGHVYHHQDSPEASEELQLDTLHEHLNWSPAKIKQVVARTRALNLIKVVKDDVEGGTRTMVQLTERGERQITRFRQEMLTTTADG